jgi:hypothetical protein
VKYFLNISVKIITVATGAWPMPNSVFAMNADAVQALAKDSSHARCRYITAKVNKKERDAPP